MKQLLKLEEECRTAGIDWMLLQSYVTDRLLCPWAGKPHQGLFKIALASPWEYQHITHYITQQYCSMEMAFALADNSIFKLS